MRAAFALTRSLRAAVRPTPSVARFAPRALSTSVPRFASENPMVDPQIQDLRDKIQAHTGCREAIIRLGEIMTKKGVDLTKPPSTMQMMKLGMDSEVREAGANLMAQLQDAGINMSPEIASQIFSKVVKDEEK